MDSIAQSKRINLAGLPVLAVILMLSSASFAASNAVIECDQVGRDLQSLEVAVAEMGVDTVDHAPLDTDIVDEVVVVSEAVAPILNLGPRVTSIMRDVFEAADEESSPDEGPQTSLSPLADRDAQEEMSEADDTAADENQLPRFQQQMRRTDI